MEEVIYSMAGGMGLILEGHENEADYIEKSPVTLHGQEMNPDDMTNLDGMFTEPIRYAGLQKNKDSKVMVFHAGNHQDLFESKSYYYCFLLITDERIANVYRAGTARDFFWTGKKWK